MKRVLLICGVVAGCGMSVAFAQDNLSQILALGLDRQQMRSLVEFRRDSMESRRQLQLGKKQAIDLALDYDSTEADVRTVIDRLKSSHEKQMDARLDKLFELKRTLTREQFETLAGIIKSKINSRVAR